MLILSMLLAVQLPPAASPPVPSSINVHPWNDGSVYPLAASPGQLSLVTLEPGEKLVSVAAGDTVQWMIGDTASGSGASHQARLLVKPVAAGLRTNMVITTDRRAYQLALESRERAPIESLRWTYSAPSLIAMKAAPPPSCPAPFDPAGLNFNYKVSGDEVAWRPVRAFDNGSQTFIEFPPALEQGAAPPLFLKGADGKLELVNYRVRGRFYVVDRIIDAAELRLGEKKQQKALIVRTAPQPLIGHGGAK